jgi:hypothetical protein
LFDLALQDAVGFGDADQRLRLAADVVDIFPQADRGAIVGKGRGDGQCCGDDECENFICCLQGLFLSDDYTK